MREDFESALKENPEDYDTRMVYADWLEEQGEWDEAARQRKWKDAHEWMKEFAEKPGDNDARYVDDLDYYDDPEYYPTFTYDRIMDSVELDEGGLYINCGANETFQSKIIENRNEFWTNWSIITDRQIDPEWIENAYAGCSC